MRKVLESALVGRIKNCAVCSLVGLIRNPLETDLAGLVREPLGSIWPPFLSGMAMRKLGLVDLTKDLLLPDFPYLIKIGSDLDCFMMKASE